MYGTTLELESCGLVAKRLDKSGQNHTDADKVHQQKETPNDHPFGRLVARCRPTFDPVLRHLATPRLVSPETGGTGGRALPIRIGPKDPKVIHGLSFVDACLPACMYMKGIKHALLS